MIFIDNKYTKWYYQIIERAKTRNAPERLGIETHHIIPECFFIKRNRKGPKGWLAGDPEDSNNKVTLTTSEHLICHRLLVKMNKGVAKAKMIHALWGMVNLENSNQERQKVTNKVYEHLKLLRSNIVSKQMRTNNPMDNPKTRAKHKDSMKTRQNKGMANKTHSIETIAKMKKARAKQIITEETKKKISRTNTGKKQSQKTKTKRANSLKRFHEKRKRKGLPWKNGPSKIVNCPHCEKSGYERGMTRYHFDNCKLFKPIV